MTDEELLRYSRHILLDEIGIENQEKINNSTVLIIGCGGLGSSASIYLAASGIGELIFVDNDKVDLTNLQRQIVHKTNNLNDFKVDSFKENLNKLNHLVKIKTFNQKADFYFLDRILNKNKIDVILDCSDNYKTRHLINEICVKYKKPLISGSAIKLQGQVLVFNFTNLNKSSCYSCLFDKNETFKELNCSELGVFSPLLGIIGSIQASECLKLICNLSALENKLLTINIKSMQFKIINLKKNIGCKVCNF